MTLQRRIMREVHGDAFTALETITGRSLLVRAIGDMGATDPLTRLIVPLEEGVDPDETYTEIPYGASRIASAVAERRCSGVDAECSNLERGPAMVVTLACRPITSSPLPRAFACLQRRASPS